VTLDNPISGFSMSGVLPEIHREASLPKYESVVADVREFSGCIVSGS